MQIVDALSDFDIKFIIRDFRIQGLKRGVAVKKFIEDFKVTSISDIEKVHRFVDEVYEETPSV